MAVLIPVVIGVVFIVALGILGGYWALYGERPRKKKLESIDTSILRKYNKKGDIPVDQKDKDNVLEYRFTGLMQTDINEKSELMARVTESGKKLLKLKDIRGAGQIMWIFRIFIATVFVCAFVCIYGFSIWGAILLILLLTFIGWVTGYLLARTHVYFRKYSG